MISKEIHRFLDRSVKSSYPSQYISDPQVIRQAIESIGPGTDNISLGSRGQIIFKLHPQHELFPPFTLKYSPDSGFFEEPLLFYPSQEILPSRRIGSNKPLLENMAYRLLLAFDQIGLVNPDPIR